MPFPMDGIEPVSSHEELQPTVQGGTNQSLNASETASATEERSDNPKRKFDGEAQKGGEGNVADAESKETPAGALILLEQLRARRQARDSGTWDVEDADLEHAQMNDVAVHVISCSSDASDDSSSTEIGKICPMRRSPSSIEFENMTSVPYHAQYQRIVEEEEAAEMERLLQQLDEEQQAVQDMAVAQRYQLMQEQIALIQMQLGNENAEVPDLKWLMANDPDNSHELDEVIAAFAARDDDLPQETPEAPDIPLTCKNFFCRCPWRDNMRKDEKMLVEHATHAGDSIRTLSRRSSLHPLCRRLVQFHVFHQCNLLHCTRRC